jgi:hypothetical protein
MKTMTNLKPKDAPKGWIKLEPVEGFRDETFYIRESKIIGVGHPKAGNEAVTGVHPICENGNPLPMFGSISAVVWHRRALYGIID